MTFSFNLVHERWLPCITLEGKPVELGLLEALTRAHELRELYDESPLITVALHRLLLAILHRIFGPEDVGAWYDLWQGGHWPEDALRNYFQQWDLRFDLFDPVRPFYQQLDERVQDKEPWPSLSRLHSSANNATLFNHATVTDTPTLTPAEAARSAVAVQAFQSGGPSPIRKPIRVDFRDGACTRGVSLFAEGNTLFETLALNLVQYPLPENVFQCRTDDLPAWEMDDPYTPERQIPLGYMDYLTWQTVKVMLHPEVIDDAVVVRHMHITPGLALNDGILNPIYHYRSHKDGPKMLRFNERSALWRNSAALLQISSREMDQDQPPFVVDWLADLVNVGLLDRHLRYRFMALGMKGNQAKVEFYRYERLPLPLIYLSDQSLVDPLQKCTNLAEDVYNKLRSALYRLAAFILVPDGSRKPDKDAVGNLLNHWAVTSRYWASLKQPFYHMMDTLPDDPRAAQMRWHHVLRDAAWDALEQAIDMVGNDVKSVRATVAARDVLVGGLKKALPEFKETEA